MSLEMEIVKVFIYFGIFFIPEFTVAVIYGFHKKIGVALILAGLIVLTGATIVVLVSSNIGSHNPSWSPFFAGILNGLMLTWIWNKGVNFGRRLRNEF